MKRILNYTPHTIFVKNASGEIVAFEPVGQTIRVNTETVPEDEINGIPTQVTSYASLTGVPAVDDNTVFLVSSMVLEAAKRIGYPKGKFIAPATGPNDGAERNKKGHIIHVTRFNV